MRHCLPSSAVYRLSDPWKLINLVLPLPSCKMEMYLSVIATINLHKKPMKPQWHPVINSDFSSVCGLDGVFCSSRLDGLASTDGLVNDLGYRSRVSPLHDKKL